MADGIDKADRKNIKVCLVGSSGGHLDHLYALKPYWENKDRFWATFDKEDTRTMLMGETIYHVYYPSNRSIKALIINTFMESPFECVHWHVSLCAGISTDFPRPRLRCAGVPGGGCRSW